MQSQQRNQSTLSIRDFISIASLLAYKACGIVKSASENKDLLKYEKGHDDPVTEADYHIQTMIINGLAHFFPKLRVIGEETVDYKGEITVDYQKMDFDFCPKNAKFENLSVPYEEVCVWIDPIDCTKGFIGGKTEYVTTLIGMSRNKQAYVGVVGSGFKKVGDVRQYCPNVSIGVVETKEAFVFEDTKQWNPLQVSPIRKVPLITTSHNRVNPLFNGITDYLKGKNVFSGGAGRKKKIMMVVDGSADMLAYVASFTSKWDSCAGEAIVKAMGGYFLTEGKEELIYDPDAEHYSNLEGQIVTMSKQLLDKVFEYLETIKNKNHKK